MANYRHAASQTRLVGELTFNNDFLFIFAKIFHFVFRKNRENRLVFTFSQRNSVSELFRSAR
jgi:hypothetical protein